MPLITFLPDGRTLEVPKGMNLMTAIIQAGLPIGSSCGALGICAKCFVQILDGMDHLSKPNPIERKLLSREKFGRGIRISCQTKVLDSVTVTTSYW